MVTPNPDGLMELYPYTDRTFPTVEDRSFDRDIQPVNMSRNSQYRDSYETTTRQPENAHMVETQFGEPIYPDDVGNDVCCK
jgi:hypothetical protein